MYCRARAASPSRAAPPPRPSDAPQAVRFHAGTAHRRRAGRGPAADRAGGSSAPPLARVVSPCGSQLLYEVEDADRHVLLGAARHVQLAGLTQDRHLVEVGVETD